MTDLRQTEHYARYMESLGWIVEHSPGCNIFIKKLWFTAIAKIQHPRRLNLAPLKKYHPFLIKLEPLSSPTSPTTLKFHPDSWPLIPSKTLILDLENYQPAKDIRYEIRKAEKNQVKVEISSDIETFIKLWHQNARDRGFWVPLHKEIRNLATTFGRDCFLFLAYFSPKSPNPPNTPNSPLSGALVLKNGSTAHYMYAFSTPAGRKVSAPYLVMAEIIKFLQSRKVRYFDLEGIYDDRYPSSTKNWQGFTKFKMQWGGKIVEYPGSFSKYLIPFTRTTS